ncbi:MAG: hypothetical protein EXQ53_12220, partial [Acidobacteria bacterium]|nr:hypothetical protein [Acidobacteriota bacterium]
MQHPNPRVGQSSTGGIGQNLEPSRTSARTLAYALAAVPALAIGYVLLRMPLQVTDSLTLILDAAESRSVWESFYAHTAGNGYFRPLFYAEIKLLFDVAQGQYQLTYRLFHAASLLAFVLLFVRALDLRSRAALVAVPLALTVFFGMHTFLATVKEIYPVSHFLQSCLLALVALNLAQSKGGLRVDIALVVTFVAAALTIESGLLVWVVVAAAWMTGAPGVSTRALTAVSAVFVAYFLVRFGVYGTEMPVLYERSAGFLLERLDPGELRQRFGDRPMPFYVYNVLSSVSSVLLSQPRSGTWILIRQFVAGDVPPRTYINLGAALFATGLILAYVIDRVRAGVRWPRTQGDRQVFIFAAVLAANAVISFGYTKDEIVSVAGTFYAVAVFAATVHLLDTLRQHVPSWPVVVVLAVLFCSGGALWATRAAGVHSVLLRGAFTQRNDWAHVEQRMRENGDWVRYSGTLPLLRSL